MPVKKSKCGGKKAKCPKRCKQVGGWFWEANDPIFGKSNRWLGENIIQPADKFLKDTKILSKIAAPVVGLITTAGSFNPALGAVAATVATAGLSQAGYGRRRSMVRPSGKYGQHGGNSPFMLTTNSSFNSIKI